MKTCVTEGCGQDVSTVSFWQDRRGPLCRDCFEELEALSGKKSLVPCAKPKKKRGHGFWELIRRHILR